METNYKLKSHIKEFILNKAKEHPELGCRKISLLVQEHLKTTVSKSSISSILKAAGVNKPVGRRRINANNNAGAPLPQEDKFSDSQPYLPAPERTQFLISHKIEANPGFKQLALGNELMSIKAGGAENTAAFLANMGCWFLKAADLCLGGILGVTEVLSEFVKDSEAMDLTAKNEAFLYGLLFADEKEPCQKDSLKAALYHIIGQEYQENEVISYNEYLKQREGIGQKVLRKLKASLEEALSLKFTLKDGTCYFIDAACHSVWQAGRIPGHFSAALHKTKDFLNKAIVTDNQPLILQSPPGFNAPALAFLHFLSSFQAENTYKLVKSIEVYTINNELLETFQPAPWQRRYFILGVWPWQYAESRRALSSPAGMVFTEPHTGQAVRVRAVAMKKNGREIATIITNIEEHAASDDAVITLYAQRWPNLEIGYQDFLNKIESAHLPSQGKPEAAIRDFEPQETALPVAEAFNFWLKELSSYCQKHFFPSSCKGCGFQDLNERYYGLSGRVERGARRVKVAFSLPEGFPYAADLDYGCQRVNEADIRLSGGERLTFEAE